MLDQCCMDGDFGDTHPTQQATAAPQARKGWVSLKYPKVMCHRPA